MTTEKMPWQDRKQRKLWARRLQSPDPGLDVVHPHARVVIEPGFEQFLKDGCLSADATEEEIEFLKMLKFKGRRPSPLY